MADVRYAFAHMSESQAVKLGSMMSCDPELPDVKARIRYREDLGCANVDPWKAYNYTPPAPEWCRDGVPVKIFTPKQQKRIRELMSKNNRWLAKFNKAQDMNAQENK